MPAETKPALPFTPYEGEEPYIFVSYAHANAGRVYPIIKQLHEMGYRLWYDEGIEVGDEWPEVICSQLLKAACMLLFLSPHAAASKWVKKEINVATMNDIKIVGAFLTKTIMPPAVYYQLSDVQMLFYKKFDSDAAFIEKLRKGIPPNTQGKSPPEQKPAVSFINVYDPPTVIHL